MKINKISIKNFKVFKSFFIDFESSDTIVFDGPNGFGKTTLYDAIELVFTGRIRRYNALKTALIDGRQTFEENPFYNENAHDKEDINIKIQFTIDSSIYVLERNANSSQITGSIDFDIYRLYTKTDFDTDESILVEDEKLLLTEIFGKNYDTNFQFLNYVEQEECLFLLKSPDKSRKNYIAHLFDLKEFEIKIKRIVDLKSKIDELCNNQKRTGLETLDQEIKKIRQNLLTDISETEYSKLFDTQNFDWDEENVDFDVINYHEIAGSNGIFNSIKLLITRKNIYKQYRKNSVANYLIENGELIHSYLKYSFFLPSKDELRTLRNEVTSLRDLVVKLTNLDNQNLTNVLDLSSYLFISVELQDRFSKAKKELQNILSELSGLDRVYADISISRGLLKEKLVLLKENNVESGECLLCGYDWGTIEELLERIEFQTSQIKNINSEKSASFEMSFAEFKTGLVQELIKIINVRLSDIPLDSIFVDTLLKIEANQFNQITNAISFLKIDYDKYLNKSLSSSALIYVENFLEDVGKLKESIDEQLIEGNFSEIFNDYFKRSYDKLDLMTVNDVEKKQKYLTYIWSLGQNELLLTLNAKYNNDKKELDDAKKLSDKLNFLKNKYQGSLTSFQTKIIRDIEIIFHVYSGRIMQCFQGGLGLFIYSAKEGLRFQSNPYKTYDAVFSMSSGQLSALIISFTLALHKKYSQNKLILIDDPVQTMDELNLYGFIDLLRNEFSNRQIIMSTHEDMMSAFMRYKFKNYNLSEQRVNLKELLQD